MKLGKVKASKAAKSGPSKEELHAVVSDILKEVDFNTVRSFLDLILDAPLPFSLVITKLSNSVWGAGNFG